MNIDFIAPSNKGNNSWYFNLCIYDEAKYDFTEQQKNTDDYKEYLEVIDKCAWFDIGIDEKSSFKEIENWLRIWIAPNTGLK